MHKITKILAALLLTFAAATTVTATYAEESDSSADDIETTSLEAPSDPDDSDSSDSDFASTAGAGQIAPAISMKPTNEYVIFSANEVIENKLTVSNPGDSPYDFKLYAQPYVIDDSEDNYTFAFDSRNSYSEIASWVTFQDESGNFVETSTFHLDPGTEREIIYRVSTPSSITAGGQYAALFAETINEEANGGASINGIYTVSRVALLLYGRSSEGAEPRAEIADYSVKSFLTGGLITASSRVKSSGNTDVTATYKMIVRGIFGNDLFSNTWSYPVLPGTTRFASMSWEDTPAFGIFSVQYSVSAGEQVENRTTIVLIYPVWMIILTILLLTALGFWITINIKKRKERKSRLIV